MCAVEVAAELAARIGGKNLTTRPAGDPTPPGAVIVVVLDAPLPPADGDRSVFSIQTAQI